MPGKGRAVTPKAPPSPARLRQYWNDKRAAFLVENTQALGSLSYLPSPDSYRLPPTPDRLPGSHFADTLRPRSKETPDALSRLAQKRENFRFLLDQIRNEAGFDVGPKWQAKEEMGLDVKTSVNLARKLSRAFGDEEKPFYLNGDKNGRRLFNLDFLTGQFREIREFRNCCLLPAVAKARRAAPRRLLEWYFAKMEVENDNRKFGHKHKARMIVFNAGKTVPVDCVGARIKEVCDKVSDAFERTAAAGFPVVPLCRNIELAGFWDEKRNVIKRDALGRVLYHVHSHVLVEQTRRMSRKEWSDFLQTIGAKEPEPSEEIVSEAKQKAGKAWEAGLLASPAEATKYVTKVKGLELLPKEELGALFRQTFRRKMLHLLGPALAQSIAWKAEKKTLCAPRNGRPWEIGPTKPGPDESDKTKAPDRPQVLTVTRPHSIFGRFARPSLLVRCKPADVDRALLAWLDTPQGRQIQFLTVAAMHARDALEPALEAAPPQAGKAFSPHYGDSFQSRTGNAPPPTPPDPAEVCLIEIFPDFYD